MLAAYVRFMLILIEIGIGSLALLHSPKSRTPCCAGDVQPGSDTRFHKGDRAQDAFTSYRSDVGHFSANSFTAARAVRHKLSQSSASRADAAQTLRTRDA